MHWLIGTPAGSVVFIFLAVIIAILLYFLPTILAIAGHHPHIYWLGALNLVLAWTVIVWAILLAWALMQHDTDTFDNGDRPYGHSNR